MGMKGLLAGIRGAFREVIRGTMIETRIPSEGEWSFFLGQWGGGGTWGVNGALTVVSGSFNMNRKGYAILKIERIALRWMTRGIFV
ncbi:hypothetical protein [Desulfitobacterium sp. PCE1]|uniref:hypothetical protein n=1 Tax=Desulfitobacterium sp. PCE1 TaxID=146907 RepID=UPI0003647AC4|nr:hypothetical protein [Desulfitobacterium sp. PCE1]